MTANAQAFREAFRQAATRFQMDHDDVEILLAMMEQQLGQHGLAVVSRQLLRDASAACQRLGDIYSRGAFRAQRQRKPQAMHRLRQVATRARDLAGKLNGEAALPLLRGSGR